MHCADPEQLQRDALRGRNMAAEAQTATTPHWTKICSWNRLREQSPDWFGSEPLSLTRLCQVVDSGRLFSNRNCCGPGRTSCSQNRLESSVSSCCCFPSMSVCVFVNLMLHHHRVLGRWWLSWWSRCFMCRGCVLAAGPVWSFSCQMKVQRQKTKQATTKTSTYPLVNVQTQNSHRVYTFIRHDAARTDGREHLERMKHREKLHFKKLSCLCGQARGSSGAARLSRTVSVGICGETNHLAGFTLWILNELWSVCCGAAGFWRRLFQCYFFFLLYCSVRFAASVFFQYCSNPRWVNRTSTHTVRTYCCSSLFCKEVILFG